MRRNKRQTTKRCACAANCCSIHSTVELALKVKRSGVEFYRIGQTGTTLPCIIWAGGNGYALIAYTERVEVISRLPHLSLITGADDFTKLLHKIAPYTGTLIAYLHPLPRSGLRGKSVTLAAIGIFAGQTLLKLPMSKTTSGAAKKSGKAGVILSHGQSKDLRRARARRQPSERAKLVCAKGKFAKMATQCLC